MACPLSALIEARFTEFRREGKDYPDVSVLDKKFVSACTLRPAGRIQVRADFNKRCCLSGALVESSGSPTVRKKKRKHIVEDCMCTFCQWHIFIIKQQFVSVLRTYHNVVLRFRCVPYAIFLFCYHKEVRLDFRCAPIWF